MQDDQPEWQLVASFSVPGKPVPKARPRARLAGGHARIYTPATTKRYEALVASRIPRNAPSPGKLVKVHIQLYLPKPKQRPPYMPKWLWSHPEPFHRSVGDIDNYCKAILDACDHWMGNDVGVVELHAVKRTSHQPRVDVQVYGMPDLIRRTQESST